MNILSAISLISLSLLLIHCHTKETSVAPIIETKTYSKKTIQYSSIEGVDSHLLSLDIYYFDKTVSPKPVVIYVHGGGFALGDKENNITNKQNLFSSLGYIFVSINYRLSPSEYNAGSQRIMYPTHNNDVADAIQWIYNNIHSYGGNNQKIALLGHSAGAHLVALTAISDAFLPVRGLDRTIVKGVACIDTEGYDVEARCKENNEVYLNAFGDTGTFWLEASPIHMINVGEQYPDFFIAKRGTPKRISYADAFIAKLLSAQVSVYEITANHYDHEGINDAIGAQGETAVTKPLQDFFAEVFR